MAQAKKWIIGGVVVVVLAGAALLTTYQGNSDATKSAVQQDPSQAAPRAMVGYHAPAFALQTLEDSKTVSLDELKGKPVILNFWASWCGPCRSETPDLQATYEKYQDKAEFYAINLSSQDDLNSAKEFLSQLGITIPVLKDADGKTQSAYKIISVPTTLVLDRDGIVKERREGALTKVQMEGMLQRAVAGQ